MFTLSVKLIDREKIGSHVKIGALDLSDILNIEISVFFTANFLAL